MRTAPLTTMALAIALVSTCAGVIKAQGQTQPAPAAARAGQVFRTGVLHPNYNASLPTLFLIGDSTVKNSWDTGSDGLWGWGRPLTAYFDESKINVENQALGGTSSRSYIT